MPRVAIAGGGISGLALAWELRRRGIEAQLFEGAARVGGKIASSRVTGFTLEEGPNSFMAGPDAERLVEEAGLGGQRVRAAPEARERAVISAGRTVRVPSSLEELIRTPLLGWRDKARAAGEVLVRPRLPGTVCDESVLAFARRRFGPAAAEKLFLPMVSGLYAADPEQTSLRCALPRLAEMERSNGSVLRALLGRRRAATEGALTTFAGGMGALPEALSRGLGAGVCRSAAVRRLQPLRGGWRLSLEEGGAARELDFDAVVLAVPAAEAAELLAPLDAGLSETIGAMPYAPLALVQLGFARVLPGLRGHGVLVLPSEGASILGAVFVSTLFPQAAPRGSSLLMVRVGGMLRPGLARLPDAELLVMVRGALARLLGIQDEPSLVRVVRHAAALPQYTLGHSERLARIDAAERDRRGLFLTGNAFRGLGIPDCLRNATRLADRICALP